MRLRYKNTSGYCEQSDCRYWDKCSLKITEEIKAKAATMLIPVDIKKYCVYKDHTFNPKSKDTENLIGNE